jgi:hypothetical protein
MSEVRVNILDSGRCITGTVHGSIGDSIVAGLSDEPETIEELEWATARYIKPMNDVRLFAEFSNGVDVKPWDAGILFIDLAARVVASESSYSAPSAEGQVQYHNGAKAIDVWLPYSAPHDWLFFNTIAEYQSIRDERRVKNAAFKPIDFRPVLFGSIAKHIAGKCLASRASNAENPIAEIHAQWLMTPRDDLDGRSPREVMFVKRDFIDYDLQLREQHWGILREPAPCLKHDSNAYRVASFGTHSVVVYYDMVRHLLTECWNHIGKRKVVPEQEEVRRLEQIKTKWLERPNPEYCEKSPAYVLECERERLPLRLSAEEAAREFGDDDCPCCKLAIKNPSPIFWHLDGSNMDRDFPFSLCDTREEWEDEESSYEYFNEEDQSESQPQDSILH